MIARRHGVDLYRVGSGNPGATNVERAVGRGAALVVLGLDGAKGLLATLVAAVAGGDGATIAAAGAFAVLGHVVPARAPTKGGKGVATAAGALLGFDPVAGLATAGVYLAARRISRYGSVGSLAGVAVGVLAACLRTGQQVATIALLGMLGLVVVRHAENLRRLARGDEPRIGDPAPDLDED